MRQDRGTPKMVVVHLVSLQSSLKRVPSTVFLIPERASSFLRASCGVVIKEASRTTHAHLENPRIYDWLRMGPPLA